MINKIKHWVKQELGITTLELENEQLKQQLIVHEKFVTSKIAELKEFSRVDADIGIRGNNSIILTGVYKKRAFVKFYDLGDGEFEKLIHQLKDMKGYALIRNVDKLTPFFGSFDL